MATDSSECEQLGPSTIQHSPSSANVSSLPLQENVRLFTLLSAHCSSPHSLMCPSVHCLNIVKGKTCSGFCCTNSAYAAVRWSREEKSFSISHEDKWRGCCIARLRQTLCRTWFSRWILHLLVITFTGTLLSWDGLLDWQTAQVCSFTRFTKYSDFLCDEYCPSTSLSLSVIVCTLFLEIESDCKFFVFQPSFSSTFRVNICAVKWKSIQFNYAKRSVFFSRPAIKDTAEALQMEFYQYHRINSMYVVNRFPFTASNLFHR